MRYFDYDFRNAFVFGNKNSYICHTMTSMIQYISHLLHYHDCVIVPGLGGFVSNRQTAQINEKQHFFMPPSKEIGFNRSLLHNDGLLTNYVAQENGISYSKAMTLIDIFVAKVHSDIFAGLSVDMGSIGSLRGDAIGNLLFTPKEMNTFLPEAFGLTPFRFEPVGYKHEVQMGYETQPISLFHSKLPRYWVAVAALMTGFFFLTTNNLNTPTVSKANLADMLFVKKEIVETPKVIAVEVEAEENVNHVANTPHELPEKVEYARYHLIASSLQTPNQALAVKNKFIQQGFNSSRILDDGKGHYRVSIQSYNNFQEAVKEMKEYRTQSEFAGVWVLKNR